MREKQNVETIYYKSFADDVVVNSNQDYRLPSDYVWVKKNPIYRFCSTVVFGFAWFVSYFYCKFGLHMTVKNRKVLKGYRKKGYFLYGNHTQPVGDVFSPARVCGRKRFYSIASPANLGVPVIGKLLPMLGALPVPQDLHQMKKLWTAIRKRISEKSCVVIFPEAHVWPYYTKIRHFPETSFRFPVENKSPSFCMTATYQKRALGKKPRMILYVDGPFFPDQTGSKKEQQKKLRDEIWNCMCRRSQESNCTYIQYEEESCS